MIYRKLLLLWKAVCFCREHGIRRTLARSFHRIFEILEVPEDPEKQVIKISGLFPGEAQAIPIKKVANSQGRPRISLVLPTINQSQLYAGVWTALKIFWETKKAQGYRVRILSVTSPYNTEGLGNLDFIGNEVNQIEFWQREDNVPCEVEDDEIFIVTAWWTAFVIKELEKTNRIFYLVQDFEPGFYPWSYRYELALESYKLDYARIYNTSILYDFFKEQNLHKGRDEIFFEPGIDRGLFYPAEKKDYESNGKATILIYGRPAVSRNLFEAAILGLDRFLKTHPEYREKIGEIISVGEKHGKIAVDGFIIRSLGKLSLAEWAALARKSDIGLSLMYSPHPSYPPLEMVASGMLVISNRVYNKNLEKVNDNFISVDIDSGSIAAGIKNAIDRLSDRQSIQNHAEQFLSQRNWEDNLKEVTSFIGAGKQVQAEAEPAAGPLMSQS